MTATISGRACSEVRLTMPRYGTWTAWVTLADAGALPEGPGSASLSVAGLALVGTVEEQGERAGFQGARLVGGFGGWGAAPPPAGFQADNLVSVETFARALALAVGEVVPEEDLRAYRATKLGTTVARLGGLEAGALLSQALALPSGQVVPWWVQADGRTRLGARSGAAVTADKIDSDETGRAFVYALDDATPLLPGGTIDGLVIDELRLTATGDSVREVAVTSAAGEDEGTLSAKFRRLVLQVIGPLVFAARIYRYTVDTVHADGRISARPVRSLLAPTLDRKPLWPGLAGGRAVPQEGSMILVQFADGDHRAPVVVGFEPATGGGIPIRTELDGALVRLGSAGAAPYVARVGDVIGRLVAEGPNLFYSAGDNASGAPYVALATNPFPSPPSPPAPIVPGTLLVITSGSSKVQAG